MSIEKARLAILSELMSFPMIRSKDWIVSPDLRDDLMCGDLVAMSSAPVSKWYLSWLKEIEIKDGYTYYTLESIEDGELCRWSNISLTAYDRERVAQRPDWKWMDKQFEFYNRWMKTCSRNDDGRLRGGSYPIFNDDGSVELTLHIRILYDDDTKYIKIFPNWKKLTIKQMGEFYIESSSKFEEKLAA